MCEELLPPYLKVKTYCFLCTRHRSGHFTWILSSNPKTYMLIGFILQMRKTEWDNLPKVTELVPAEQGPDSTPRPLF